MAGPPVRQRYNAKARGSVAGGSSHKKRKNITKERTEEHAQDNGNDQHDAGLEDPTAGMSSKKRKRFESYMNSIQAKKLKSEQRLETFKLLQSLAPSSSTSASLLSASTLGQNPLNPTSAKERQEKREDRLVRRGIDRLSRRFGEGDDDSGESENDAPSRKGKGKAREVMVEVIRDGQVEEKEEVKTTVLPSKGDRKAEIKTAGKSKRKGKLPKKAEWNPNLLSTQAHNSSSSEFNSSDSANDTSDEEEPKKTAEPSPKIEPEPASETTKLLISAPSAPPVLGGALRKAADGQAMKPRVEIRRKKGFVYGMFGRRGIEHREGSDDEDDEDEDDEDEDGDDDEEEEEDDEMDSDEEEGDSEEEGSEEEEEEVAPPKKKRSLGFKDWALKQMGQTSQPSAPDLLAAETTTTLHKSQPLPAARVGEYIGPLGQELVVPTTSLLDQSKDSDKSKVRPNITRRPSVSEARMGLPILAEEQSIIESILMHPVVIICGETGSGKTTQVPQMLYEAGFGYKGSDNPGMVAVTQPRRVAAVSLAERVRSELNLPPNSSLVAHQIRYSSTTSPDTAIKFMTDGVLLRELASDFLLSRYSVVVVDEAHERGVNTDVLVGVLSRVAKLREKLWREGKQDVKPLRIVVMSATLRVSDFAENPTLFSKPPPVIHIAARQHPVTVHFSRRTVSDYVTEAYKKVSKIHARLPPGGILVFMTGQSEIQALCRKLEKKYGSKKTSQKIQINNDDTLPPEEREAEEVEFGKDEDLAADVDDGAAESDPEALDTDDEIEGIPGLEFDEPADAPLHVLPLYSLLPNDQQMLVFKPPPEGHRLVIISTNVAETSLTIPGIRYVVDSGRAKERHYDPTNGVQSFQVSWISKASASQRAGRAGRTGPGHCYRLYSSALFEDHFEQFSKPEILRMPIEGVVLQMKSMNIDAVINFPFPTPPDRAALRRAENLLTNLGALSLPTLTKMINGVQHKGSAGGQITDLGKAMAGFPVSPRFAKMLAIGTQHDCMSYIIAIVAGMSVGDPFIHEQSLEMDEEEDESAEISHIKSEEIKEKEQRKETRRRFFKAQQQFLALGQGASDMFKLLAAIGAYEYDPSPAFCAKTFIRLKAMQEIHQLRAQISSIAKVPLSKLLPPNDTQLKVLRQILAAGFIDQVAVREDLVLKKGVSYESTRGVAYRAVGLGSEAVFIHPSSALFHHAPPDFVVFSDIVRTSKPWMKGITKINPVWLPSLGKGLCTFSKPMEMPTKGFAKKSGLKDDEREVFVTPHFKDLGVDLPVMKKKQRREGTRWILVD
ncbi:ATP-dependent RNA helicase DHX37/DHR1 [Cryptococcus deuterogattii LA55]|nr:ATP-dependent RNA helicase DHX37/DHR1 [Cryptococcus deuterogattii LA55]KIR92633.1 ATP-dependent RNA helicase DHX37/DHR1 [Cryptococcus deuterogattii CBS 10090]